MSVSAECGVRNVGKGQWLSYLTPALLIPHSAIPFLPLPPNTRKRIKYGVPSRKSFFAAAACSAAVNPGFEAGNYGKMPASDIVIKGAREHNLRDVSLVLPRNQLICLTGVSGSGKSSLAFDTLYAEGQRR